jgi:hypothetical protein
MAEDRMAAVEESDIPEQPVRVAFAPGEFAPGNVKIAPVNGRLRRSGAEDDQALIGRCLTGEVSAWDELYSRAHPALSISICVLLGGGPSDPNLVDEIASRVWFAMIENDGRLLARFDSARGCRLITFLRTVARTEVSRHYRRERRRLRRERIALNGKAAHQPAVDGQLPGLVDVDGFLSTLTAREKRFWDDHLAESPSEVAVVDHTPLSVNARQLRHRIRDKLLKFLGSDS